MKYREQALAVQAEGCEMLSIVSLPAKDESLRPCAVLIVTGGAQYRTGSHRQFTRMARELATAGYPAMRFDMPGMGDSTGEPIPYEKSAAHIAASVDILVRTTNVEKICLWGLCDGASASLLYMHATHDKRIAGIVLLNPWIRSETSLAKVHVKYYYPKRILRIDFWRKLLSGNIGRKALQELIMSFYLMAKNTTFAQDSAENKMAQGWASLEKPLLLLLSEKDFTAQEFMENMKNNAIWIAAVKKNPATQYIIRGADHTCSSSDSHKEMISKTLEWLNHWNENS